MKFKEFKRKMEKAVFSTGEARVVAFAANPATLKLQLHQWVKNGDLVALKKGLYMFPSGKTDQVEIARFLYPPCYVSLETALNLYGLIPEIPFALTLVTTRTTRTFNTPVGRFIYHKIKNQAFTGFDPHTLIAEREKALLDYLYLNQRNLVASADFWEELRLQNLDQLDFERAFLLADLYRSSTLTRLLESVKHYAESG